MFSFNQPLYLQKAMPLYPNPKYLYGIGILLVSRSLSKVLILVALPPIDVDLIQFLAKTINIKSWTYRTL